MTALAGGETDEAVALGRIVSSVVTRVAPHIDGLPAGDELAELVTGHALAAYAAGLADPDILALAERERRTVLAVRVGLALAFPAVPWWPIEPI